ncbi:MAG: YkvA family protein, partial [Rhodospirillaceae bacterium]
MTPPKQPIAGPAGDAAAADERYVEANFGAKVRRTLGRVGFVREAVAAYYCARDPDTPTRVKGTVLAALAYLIMPADAIPDLIAVLGYTDDATVFWAAYRLIKPYIKPAHRLKAALY